MYTILIADDEVIERTVLQKKLAAGFGDTCEIHTARNGREVLRLYEELHPQILILDIEMPGVTGLEAAEKIRQQDRDCTIIFLTAFDEFAYAKKAIAVHALDYLLKPCADEELVAAVEEAMHLVAQRQHVDALIGASGQSADTEKTEIPARGGGSSGSGYSAPGSAAVTDKAAGDTAARRSAGSDAQGIQETIRRYISENYMNDIALQDVSDELGYSEVYFCKIFKQYFGQSFVSYLTAYRIAKACDMLSDGAASIREVSRNVGYEDANYFAKVFRRVTGKSPSDFRAKL